MPTPYSIKSAHKTLKEFLAASKGYENAKRPQDFLYWFVFYQWLKSEGRDPNKKHNVSKLEEWHQDFINVNGEAPNAPRTKGKAKSEVFGSAKKETGEDTYESLIRKANMALKGEISRLEQQIAKDQKRLKDLKSKYKQAGKG